MADVELSQLVGRFLDEAPTESDIQDVSQRLSTILGEVIRASVSSLGLKSAGLPDDKWLCDQWRSRIDESLSSDNPAVRISPVWYLPHAYPELAFAYGYDEVRYGAPRIEDPTVSESARGVLGEAQSKYGGDAGILMLRTTQYRTPNGMWHDTEGLWDRLLPPQEEPGEGEHRSWDEWADTLRCAFRQRLMTPSPQVENTLSMPGLWLPSSYGDTGLHVATKRILRNIHDYKKTLEELHWRTLEEIVAELLRDLGMEVAVTERSNDGGRDVVARGELIPGEPILLAVEVKHRAVVPVSELRQALWANRRFPALLFVTSGRLSAGVYRERRQSESALRLYLKDGHGLQQWISQYCRRNFEDVWGDADPTPFPSISRLIYYLEWNRRDRAVASHEKTNSRNRAGSTYRI
jgi:hypothetical protein